jgi:hypothetical protein
LTDDFDYSRFFALAEAFERSALRVNVVEPIDVDPWAVTRGEARIDVLRCECDEGRDALDLVGTTSAVLVLLSSRVIDALERAASEGCGPCRSRSRAEALQSTATTVLQSTAVAGQ